LKEPLFKLTGQYRRATHREDHLLQTKAFKPYSLNYRKPPARGTRPVVVHVVGNFCVGGVMRLVVDIIEWMSDEYEHVVITMHNPEPPAVLGANVVEMGEKTSIREFARQMTIFNPAIIHVHHYAPHCLHQPWLWYRTAFLAAASFGVPVIEGVNVPMTPYYHPSVHNYVFVSRYVQDTFGFTHCPNRVIYPGSDFLLFAPRPRQFSDTIGMVFRLDGSTLRKDSIEVFIRVLQARSSTKAIIVGDGRLLSCFKERVQKAGLTERFTFSGYVAYETLPEIFSRLDVFVVPLFCASFGQVTPFAMNMGIPVAAYATGGVPEILDEPSVIAPTGDADALAKIILGLLADQNRSAAIARQNQARARQLFSVEAMVKEYASLYASVRQRATA
jgi:glycosyltransferase involved in cell wall biosynthesis